MGMMLETTSRRLWEEPGQVHHGSPDKDPELRMRVLRDAGRARVPFTSGVLLGIGETSAERVDSLLALRDVARETGGIQEVIVQNFRAKDDTAMRGEADLEHPEYVATIAVARLLLGADVSLQAPPNLSEPGQREQLLAAGVDDWGGVSPLTPDHVKPRTPVAAARRPGRDDARGGFPAGRTADRTPAVRPGRPGGRRHVDRAGTARRGGRARRPRGRGWRASPRFPSDAPRERRGPAAHRRRGADGAVRGRAARPRRPPADRRVPQTATRRCPSTC